MTRFADLGLADPLLQALSEEGYETPTPIQGSVIPDMLAGRDILGIAQTGTGKTAAFVLPVLQAFAEELASGTVRRPAPKTAKTLILVPTRELAYQVAESIRTYGRHLAYQMAVVVGGVRPQGQIRAMKPGVDILVATPGRLEDHMSTGVVSLEATRTLILDEADQMLDMGFIPSIRRIVAKVPNPRRTVMLTATMAPPIRALAGDFLKDPSELSVAPVSKPIERIAQSVLPIRQPEKRNALVHYLRDQDVERAIVFTRTKRGADRVSRHLEECGFASAAIHGNRSQSQRDRALNAFKAGEVQVLVATDIAARGIDIDDVSHVVNFELPTVPEAYVHRIGRTARAGKSGVALSLCDPAERNLLRDIERLTKLPIAEAKLSFDPSEELRVAPVRPFAPKPRQEHREEAAAAPPRRPRRPRRATEAKPAAPKAHHRADHAPEHGLGEPRSKPGHKPHPQRPRKAAKPGARPQGVRPQGGQPQENRAQNPRPNGSQAPAAASQEVCSQEARPQGPKPHGGRARSGSGQNSGNRNGHAPGKPVHAKGGPRKGGGGGQSPLRRKAKGGRSATA